MQPWSITVADHRLQSTEPGYKEVLDDSAFRIRTGAPPGRCGLHPLPRPTAWRPIAGPGDRTLRRTAVTSDSPAARARIFARNQTRYRSQAAGDQPSRRTDDPCTERSW